MAGISKANQFQSAKRAKKGGPHYGLKRMRMHEIPMLCRCGNAILVPSQEAYTPGGIRCRKCGERFSMNTRQFKKPEIVNIKRK